jgi:hypothetical protein
MSYSNLVSLVSICEREKFTLVTSLLSVKISHSKFRLTTQKVFYYFENELQLIFLSFGGKQKSSLSEL